MHGLWEYAELPIKMATQSFAQHEISFTSGYSLELQMYQLRDVTVPMYWDTLTDAGWSPAAICDYLANDILPDQITELFENQIGNCLEPGSTIDISAPLFAGPNPDGSVSTWLFRGGTVPDIPPNVWFFRSVVSEQLPHGQQYLDMDGGPDIWSPPLITVPVGEQFTFAYQFRGCEEVSPGACPIGYETIKNCRRVGTYDMDAIIAFLLPQCGAGPIPGGKKTGFISTNPADRDPVEQNATLPQSNTFVWFANHARMLPPVKLR